jgi:hypothetical protein
VIHVSPQTAFYAFLDDKEANKVLSYIMVILDDPLSQPLSHQFCKSIETIEQVMRKTLKNFQPA